MRTIVFSFSFVLFANFAVAQNDSTHPGVTKKNIIKLNLFALPLKTASIQYERVMTRRISLGLGVRIMPETNLPFRSVIENFVDDSTTLDQLHNLRLGNFAITPELRWYVGKKGAPRGFYIAPFVRYAQYKASLPFTYDDGGKTEKIDMNGTINA
ncbi:MAG: hypothetical protein ABIT96_09545, partial [Ferruginibacter sp.]